MTIFKTAYRPLFPLLALPLITLSLTLSGCGQSEHSAGNTKTDISINSQNNAANIDESNYIARQNFNSGWNFFKSSSAATLEDALNQQEWQPVNLPHSANIEPRIVNDQWQGDAWYKKTISFNPNAENWKGKRIILDFEGAMTIADVWLNGKKIAHHKGGYLPFSVDLSEHLTSGDNTLYVQIDNRDNQITGPKPLAQLDFNMYGGLYRNVWLRLENPIHISDPVAAQTVAGGGIFVRYNKVSDELAELDVQTHLRLHSENQQLTTGQSITVEQRLTYKGLEITANKQQLNISAAMLDNGQLTLSQTLTVEQPQLWSPSTPNLYQLHTRVLAGQDVSDIETTEIGIREFKLVDGKLYINGKQQFLRGVNRHQEYPYLGYAMSDAAQFRDAEKIKAAGFDYVRLSHYPHSKAFMQAADRLGLVLIDAILGWQYVNPDPAFSAHAVQTCRDLIRRDRNHASVLAWECSLNESAMDAELVAQLHNAVHQELPGTQTFSAGWQEPGFDIYLQARQHRLGHELKSTLPYVVSEYGDWEYYAMNAGLNQDSWGDLLQEERSSRQLLGAGDKRLQQQAANISEAHNDNFNTPAFADGYWVMFDYNRGYADDLEASGIMSIERLPKFSYYFFQSQRDGSDFSGPIGPGYMAYIASHWTPQSATRFKVYSNADKIELYLNGEPIATAEPDRKSYPNLAHAPFSFDLDAFTPGTLEARALVKGVEVARHSVSTPKPAVAIKVYSEHSSLAAQPNDTLFVYAELIDKQGENSHESNRKVEFKLSGDAELISPETIASEDGIATALVRLGKNLGSIKIEAIDLDSGARGQLQFD